MELVAEYVSFDFADADLKILEAASQSFAARHTVGFAPTDMAAFRSLVTSLAAGKSPYETDFIVALPWGDRRMAAIIAILQEARPNQLYFSFLFRIGNHWYACQAARTFARDVRDIMVKDHPGSHPLSWDPLVAEATVKTIIELNHELDGKCTASIEGSCLIQVISRVD